MCFPREVPKNLNPLQRLRTVGLLIESPDPEEMVWLRDQFHQRYHIAKPTNDPTSRRFFGADLTPFEDVVSDLYLPPSESEWLFTVSQYIPGPGPTDFICAFSSLDEAVTAVLDFYFGTPTIIERWLVPLHRHPELRLHETAIRTAIQRTIPLTYREFEQKAGENYHHVLAQDWGNDVWARAFAHQFLRFTHQTEKRTALHLRRDLRQAYVVFEDHDDED